MWRPKEGWNAKAEAEIKRLNDPFPQSERTYYEAGANAMHKADMEWLEKHAEIFDTDG